MKAEEAKAKTMEARNRLVKEQLETVHALIQRTVSEGEFSVSEHYYKFSSTRSVGWLDEVIEELRDGGYTVQLTEGTLIVSWGDTEAESEEPRLLVEGTTHDSDHVCKWVIYIISAAIVAFGLYLSS